MNYPEHLKGNTALIWMYERAIAKNPDWPLEGLVYQETDEQGCFKDIQISKAFEFHSQGNQVVVVHHPKYTPIDLERTIKKVVIEQHNRLNEKY